MLGKKEGRRPKKKARTGLAALPGDCVLNSELGHVIMVLLLVTWHLD